MASINRGDNTGAFGNDFLRIYLNNPNNVYITKAVFQINEDLVKTYEEPVFPLRVNFRGDETELLQQVNVCKLALWDEFGRRRTAEGKFTFMVKENNITEPDNPTYEGTEYYPDENAVTFDLTDGEFAAEFVINATPTKMSELQQDISFMTPEQIIGGRNIHTYIDRHKNVIIEAELETETNYEDLYNKPTINGIELVGNVEIHLEEEIPQSDWAETDINATTYIKNKPDLRTVAYTGSYNDLVNCPTIPHRVSQLTNDSGYVVYTTLNNYYNKREIDELINHHVDIQHLEERVNAIENKEIQDVEILTSKVEACALQSDFENRVTQLRIKDAELNESIGLVTTNINDIQTELNNKASKQELEIVTTKIDDCITTEQFNIVTGNLIDAETFTVELSKKANKANLNNGKLTIFKNNENQGEFTANSNIDVSINIEVPTKVSELENDSNFITDVDISSLVTKSELSNEIERKLNISDLGRGNLIIKRNNVLLDTFNANATASKTIDIEIPTNISDLIQDIVYLKDSDLDRIRLDIADIDIKIANNTHDIDSLLIDINKKVDNRVGYSLLANTEINRLSQLHNYDDTEINNKLNILTDKVDNYDLQIEDKVDKIYGKGLSTNDYTEAEKNKVDIAYNNVISISSDIVNLKTITNSLSTETDTLNQSLTTVSENIINETNNRQTADNYLQSQIDGLHAKSTVIDILGTEEELWDYDTSKVNESDVICVLKNSLYDDTTTYYRWGYQVVNYEINKQFNNDSVIKITTSKNLYFKASITGGYSGEDEPTWTEDEDTFAEEVLENTITWTKTDTISTDSWQSNYVYKIGDTITVDEGVYYTVTSLANYGKTGDTEPIWEEQEEQLDSIIDGAITWVKIEHPDTLQWMFIGSEGHYYTKAESDTKYALNSIQINGFELNDNIFLTAENVGALPLNTVIGDGTLTIQTNGIERGTFTANSTEHVTINLNVPNDLADLTNLSDDKYITENDLTTKWIGIKPENTLIQDEITNLTLKVSSNSAKIATLEGNLPAVALSGNYFDLTDIPSSISVGYKTFKDEGSDMATYHAGYTDYIDSIFLSELKTKTRFITMEDIREGFEGFALKTEIPTKVSQLENDRGYITMSTLGKGTLTIQMAGVEACAFNANSKEDITLNIPIDDVLDTTSNNLIRNKVVATAINQKATDNNVMHISGTETVTGNKTFSGNVILQNVTLQNTNGITADLNDSSTKVATTAWVKNQQYAVDSNVVHNGTNETVRGEKTFSSNVYCNTPGNSDNSTKVATTAWIRNQGFGVDSELVHLTGAETISGAKIFTSTATFSGITNLSGTTHVVTPDGTINDAVVNVAYVNSKLGDIESILDDIIAGN